MNLFIGDFCIFYEQRPQCGFNSCQSDVVRANFRLRHVACRQRPNETDFPARRNESLLLGCGFPQCPGWARLAVKPHLRDIKEEDGVHKCGGGFVLALQPII